MKPAGPQVPLSISVIFTSSRIRNPRVAAKLSPLPSLLFPFHFPPDISSGLVPIFLLLILALSSHLQFHFPHGVGRLFL